MIQHSYQFNGNGSLYRYTKEKYEKYAEEADSSFKDRQDKAFEFDDRGNLMILRDLVDHKNYYYEYNEKDQVVHSKEDGIEKDFEYNSKGDVVSYKDSTGSSWKINADGEKEETKPTIFNKVKTTINEIFGASMDPYGNKAMAESKKDWDRTHENNATYKPSDFKPKNSP